jgi:hypothetical protein
MAEPLEPALEFPKEEMKEEAEPNGSSSAAAAGFAEDQDDTWEGLRGLFADSGDEADAQPPPAKRQKAYLECGKCKKKPEDRST